MAEGPARASFSLKRQLMADVCVSAHHKKKSSLTPCAFCLWQPCIDFYGTTVLLVCTNKHFVCCADLTTALKAVRTRFSFYNFISLRFVSRPSRIYLLLSYMGSNVLSLSERPQFWCTWISVLLSLYVSVGMHPWRISPATGVPYRWATQTWVPILIL